MAFGSCVMVDLQSNCGFLHECEPFDYSEMYVESIPTCSANIIYAQKFLVPIELAISTE